MFSAGQKQQLCLARAILSKCRIIVMDEPTTYIDIETDYLIQTKMRDLTKGKTLVVVAHRVTTIIDADNIIILKNGKIIERGAPFELLVKDQNDKRITNSDGKFAQLMMALGKEGSRKLFKIARHKYIENLEDED